MDWTKILEYYFAFWFFTIPITIPITYFIITELLDLIFNSVRINRFLKHSDTLNITRLEKEYQINKERQSNLSKSNLMELKRQIDYIRLIEKESKSKLKYIEFSEERDKIIAAKKVTDIFKIK